MARKKSDLLIGSVPVYTEIEPTEGGFVELLGERYYRIAHYDKMPPFFMSLVSSSDHWFFIASTGGLTAGRVNADSALFPYETEDKITAHNELNGSKTIIRVNRDGKTFLWEPFSGRYAGVYHCERNLYKNQYGNKLIFEETNHDLQLTLRIAWSTGDRFGFIRSCWLRNHDDSGCQVELLDGLQNILPYGATSALQTSYSSLVNAYKRNELDPRTGLAIFALSATLTDRAEASESLKATVAWQIGFEDPVHLLSSQQVNAFRLGHAIEPEHDVRGRPGAYLVNASFDLSKGQSRDWNVVADVNQDNADIVNLKHLFRLEKDSILSEIDEDIDCGTDKLVSYVAAADGIQLTNDELTTNHHFANVLFNVMRGGIFAGGYRVDREDLLDFVATRNRPLLAAYAGWFAALPPSLSIQDLHARASSSAIPDLIRLSNEYLPLSFSRRHGDPSRPWNAFSINLKHSDGSPRLDYQGNWRDIFQNWEPLAYSYPEYAEGMVAKFLNATTVDGYNPYRVTRDGIEWEIPAPDDPWANIGYWNDHQIIYLQKLIEAVDKVKPGRLQSYWNQPVFSYANVPYHLREYSEMLANWNETIDFDWQKEDAIGNTVANIGTDGRLLLNEAGAVIHVTMTEKLLVLLLAKLTNLVPEGGIWMNTQRPEWNDANNALAGRGLSVVTAAYLRRFIAYWKDQLESTAYDYFAINSAVAKFYSDVKSVFQNHTDALETGFSDKTRRKFMDSLGSVATSYRKTVYEAGLMATQVELDAHDLVNFLSDAQVFIEHTLRVNLREDGLYHSYNVLHVGDKDASVENLYLMLEGQVALLSSGMLSSAEALLLTKSLRQSSLYRPDLHTYMLYPNRTLPGFLQKNNLSDHQVADSKLIDTLVQAGDKRLLILDSEGVYHFNGTFQNASDVASVLDELAGDDKYVSLVASERQFILDLFESTFNHRAFTGRSGTFFAYEGLGSVYWHMVSKLLLAVQECYIQAEVNEADSKVTASLASAYYDIRDGLGFNKSPADYGAFPTDPYSHTPMDGGARQPGMTGQVKEEILTRFGELGVSVKQGQLIFKPALLRSEEFLAEPGSFSFSDIAGEARTLPLQAGTLAFTYCQVPVVYSCSDISEITVIYRDGSTSTIQGNVLDAAKSQQIFDRDGQVDFLQVEVKAEDLQ